MVIHHGLTEPHLHSLSLNINRLTRVCRLSMLQYVRNIPVTLLCSKCFELSSVSSGCDKGELGLKLNLGFLRRREAHPLSAALRNKRLLPCRSGVCETSTYLCDERSAGPPLASAHIPARVRAARSNARKRPTLLERQDLCLRTEMWTVKQHVNFNLFLTKK